MQLTLFKYGCVTKKFPQTRYQGSKQKIVHWIMDSLRSLEYKSVLDAFGGTGVIGYEFKKKGGKVFYNDCLKFNYFIGLALIENNNTIVTNQEIEEVLKYHPPYEYKHTVQETFKNIYYYEKENAWLDMVIQNIHRIEDIYKKAILLSALFQACIIKRPFNLFHRRNLYLRSADVERNFGNKTTWDKPFGFYLKKFVREINNAVFDNGQKNVAYCSDVMELEVDTDLVYFDPPYMDSEGISVDYHNFYHFLEGITDYDNWTKQINHRTKHLSLEKRENPWNDPNKIKGAIDRLFEKYRDRIIVFSYRSDGIPSVDELKTMLEKYKSHVSLNIFGNYKYVLSHKATDEVLLVGY